jgi:DNA-binding NarL/FixJ family response regulator
MSSQEKTRKHAIVLADDHTLFREALAFLLNQDPELEVVGQAENGRDLVRVVNELKPDLVLTDIAMPQMNGTEAIGYLKSRNPDLKVIALTMYTGADYVHACFRAGANGYVLKDDGQTEFLGAVKNVLAGKTYISPAVSDVVVNGYLGVGSARPTWSDLTVREREVLKLVAEGYRNREIAELLSVSQKTVEKHRTNLMSKLDLHSTAALTTFAIEHGITGQQL